jgi:ribosome maturation factor RimP
MPMADRPPMAQKVFDAAFERVAGLGLELVDVEMVKEGRARILRLYIDKPGGVSIEDCSRVSRMIDPVIDQELDLHGHDYLEVSSPGLERPLKTDRDLIRCCGEQVELTLYQALDGRKKFQGILAPCTPEAIIISQDDGTDRQFPREQVARVKRMIRT